MGILKGIEERRNQQGKDKKKVNKLGGKGSRELKNLINHINYDNGSAKSSGNLGRGVWFVLHAAENHFLECWV